MNFINSPIESPKNITHKIFYSDLYNHEIGYNIYLPPGYDESVENYPVAYHLHGWTGNESSEIWQMEKICSDRKVITVFPNNSPVIENYEDLPVVAMIINEFIPYIDKEYRTKAIRGNRSISGFSMGGGMAFYCAIKYPESFSSVTAYAGTYHHYYHKDYRTVGVEPEKADEIYKSMINEAKHFETNSSKHLDISILDLIKQNAEKVRGNSHIKIHVGTADVLFCDNEILRLHLESLNIPHEYKTFDGIGHELDKIL